MSINKPLQRGLRKNMVWWKVILGVVVCSFLVMFFLLDLQSPASHAQAERLTDLGKGSEQSDKRSVIGTARATPTAPQAEGAATAAPVAPDPITAGNGGFEANDSIANGDFEQGHVAWTEYSTHGWDIIMNSSFPTGITPHGGSYAGWLGGDYSDTSYLQQQVIIPAAQPYLLYYHWIASTETSCSYDTAKVMINGTVINQYNLCGSTQTGGWVSHTVSLLAYAGQAVTLRIQVETDSSLNSNLFVDDVSIVTTGALQLNADKQASKTNVLPGETLTYTIILSNPNDSAISNASVTDTLPLATYYLPGTLQASSGAASYNPVGGTPAQPTIYWSGAVPQHTSVSITFAVTAAVDLPNLTQVINTAQINDGTSVISRNATILVGEVYQVYLPVILKRWPPVPDVPVLNSIANADGDGSYGVNWNTAYLASTYTLEEDDNLSFLSPTTRYAGVGLSWAASGQPVGTYYYRVKASNSWGDSGWSNTQTVNILPPPTPTPTPTPIPGLRYWVGTTSRGNPMSFTVTVNRTTWSHFTLETDFTIGGCSGTSTIDMDGPGPITNNKFSGGTDTYNFTGKFTSATAASGTYNFANYYLWDCGYLTQSGTWTATRQ